MGSTEAIVIVLLVVVIVVTGTPLVKNTWKAQTFRVSSARLVESRIDGARYRVHTGYRRPIAAADFLAVIHGQCVDIMEHMRTKYLRTAIGSEFPERANITQRLLDNYDPDTLTESAPHNPEGDTSYSLDKGKLLAICIRERHAEEIGEPVEYDLHDVTTVMFVVTHELAHLGTLEFGHPPKFWSCFKLLLLEAIEAGIVPTWPDYDQFPARYCGISIDYSPINDASVLLPS